MAMKRFVGVGACYMDTILSVSRFVTEDEKLRASHLERRRGGNCPNTLEVLQQLIASLQSDEPAVMLKLISTLPDRDSAAVREIQSSLGEGVSIDSCIFRDGQSEPASSYIIKNLATGSRTIINYNALPEMTYEEFVQKADALGDGFTWYHFEGRIPDVTLRCIRYLRDVFSGHIISVEIEKPEREGLQELVPMADVVFYSKGWAQGNGYKSAEECVQAQAKLAPNVLLLCCTWGEHGASALQPGQSSDCENIGTFTDEGLQVVDTIGAGDTFIAGILYSFVGILERWTLSQRLAFATELAGRKVGQEGFAGLGELMRPWPAAQGLKIYGPMQATDMDG